MVVALGLSWTMTHYVRKRTSRVEEDELVTEAGKGSEGKGGGQVGSAGCQGQD